MVRELQIESKVTTVFVTHDQEEALALSDIVAVMDRGRIVQMGAPSEIYAQPANGYAADFLGSANLIPTGDGKYKVVRREEIEIGSPTVAGVAGAGDDVGGGAGAGDDGKATGDDIPGRIEGVEFRGSVTGYRVRTAVGLIHVDPWSVQHGRTHERGEEVVLRIPSNARVVEGQ